MKRATLAVCCGLALIGLSAWAVNRTNVVEGVTIVIYDEPGTYSFVPEENISSARMLVVGGGGSGGGITGGGGGGGEVVEIASQALSEGTTYAITVGAGGASANGGNGKTGGNSSFVNDGESISFTALGGGAGSGGWDVYDVGTKLDGANGGGRGGNSDKVVAEGGSPTAVGGHKGGACGKYGAGGGGGMAEDGYDSLSETTAKRHCGGAGVYSDITGASVMYGYGGAGKLGTSGANNEFGKGAYQASSINYPATAGEDGTGGGGGGGSGDSEPMKNSGAGGCGTVIISYSSGKKMPAEFELTGYTGWVDGNPHTVTVTPIWPSEYSLEYSLNGTSSFSSEIPQITTAGSNEVFVAMYGPTCTRTVKSAVVWLVERENPLLNQYTETGSHTFTTPANVIADILVVGGGGSGAGYGGGGGGGFVIYREGVIFPKDVTCSITVGDGGASVSSGSGKNGEDSSFIAEGASVSYVAPGGGYGGGTWGNVNGGDGGNGGGCGGNGQYQGDTTLKDGGKATVAGGHKGGLGNLKGGMGSGGGGMSEDGHPADGDRNGGAGLTNDITGVSVIYGAGGGGCMSGKGGSGDGSGDGAQNSSTLKTGVDGNPNTGCGGGGAYYQNTSGAGGSGIVVIRYQYLEAVPPVIDDALKGEVMEDNHLRITGSISYLGSGASSCTVEYYLGTDPDALSLVGSDTVTESGAAFDFDSATLLKDTVYYWKAVATPDMGVSKSSDVRRVRSCGKWHFEDGIIDDGVWAFAVAADASGSMTVGAWTKYPSVASKLDFTKDITDGTDKAYVITKLNPQFSVIKSASSLADRGDCTASLAAPYVAELRLPTVGLATIDRVAFANCTALTNVVPYLPDSVTTLGAGAFWGVPAVQDLRLLGIAAIQCNVFKNAGVTSVTFGPSLKTLISYSNWGSFENCANLTNLAFDAEMSGATFGGEYGQFNNCWKLTGAFDATGFGDLFAANSNGPLWNTGYTNVIIGTNTTLLSRGFFTGSSIENIYFEGLPPATLGTPFTWHVSPTKTVRTHVHRKFLKVKNSAGKCWLDYAKDGQIRHLGTTWSLDYLAQDESQGEIQYKITDPSVRPLLTIEPDGLIFIVQ